MRIPVVFATDENYIFYTCTAITSLAQSAGPDTEYDVFILTSPDFPSGSIVEETGHRYSNINVTIMRVNPQLFENVVIHNGHVTRSTFYRLLLSDMLEEERCIYLDSDICVTDDLQALFQTELDEYYVAGCRDIWIDLLPQDIYERRRNRAGLPSLQGYINAGVLLMNLKKIREDGMDRVFMQHLNRDYEYEDQDIINVCCYGSICHLPARWNIFTLFLGQIDTLRENGISGTAIRELQERKGIIHYATPFIRPWEHTLYWANGQWWKIAEQWKETEYYRRLREKVLERERTERWSYCLERCAEYGKIVIFGFTGFGCEVCEWLLRGRVGGTLLFCDNDPEKSRFTYKGIGVVSLTSVDKRGTLFINVSQRRSLEVQQELLEQGVKKEDILFCSRNKPDGYYRYLDSRYYMEELRDIFLRERGPGLGEFQEDLTFMRELLSTDLQYQALNDRYHMKEWLLRSGC